MYAIRRARPRELPELVAIERRSDERFREVGLEKILDDEAPRPLSGLQAACSAGRLWVADLHGEPVGFALVEIVDGTPHLEELSVVPEHGRQGLGRRLLETVCDEGCRAGHGLVTLTTYSDVAWNGPFYRRHGFEPVPDDAVGPELAALRRREHDEGLDVAPREILRRRLAPA